MLEPSPSAPGPQALKKLGGWRVYDFMIIGMLMFAGIWVSMAFVGPYGGVGDVAMLAGGLLFGLILALQYVPSRIARKGAEKSSGAGYFDLAIVGVLLLICPAVGVWLDSGWWLLGLLAAPVYVLFKVATMKMVRGNGGRLENDDV